MRARSSTTAYGPLLRFLGRTPLLRLIFKLFRLDTFDSTLAEEVIDMQSLKELCFGGVPDGKGRRAVSWRLLLNYLPPQRSQWNEVLDQQRELYRTLTEEIVLQPLQSSKEHHEEDHPLNPNPDSQWQSFFKDNEVLLQIDKDVRRLCPDISFFSQATEYPNEAIGNVQL